ncbi:MAG: PP2C family protein-serine/threonine phosphatase [Terriglobales bacterium]
MATASAVASGIVAIGFAWLGTRGHYLYAIVLGVAISFGWPLFFSWLVPNASASPGAPATAAFAILAIIVAYVLMLVFIGTEGRRFLRLHTEVDLAAKIQQALAPAIQRQLGQFEFAGAARPSGTVGGDLVDLVGNADGWFGYVADVAGHGVAAGVLTGVVKSAVRTNLLHVEAGQRMATSLNQVLHDLLPPESFVAFAGLSAGANGSVRFVAAGQPPLLHYQAASGQVLPVAVENFPLGMFPEGAFAETTIACQPGDVLAVFTDGFTDIFDRQQREFGLDGLTAVLTRSARRPLPELLADLAAAAQAFGPQTDDQTMLLLRRRPLP